MNVKVIEMTFKKMGHYFKTPSLIFRSDLKTNSFKTNVCAK